MAIRYSTKNMKTNTHVQVSVVGDKAFITSDTLLIEMTVSRGLYNVTHCNNHSHYYTGLDS